jgi:hypothetical protein
MFEIGDRVKYSRPHWRTLIGTITAQGWDWQDASVPPEVYVRWDGGDEDCIVRQCNLELVQNEPGRGIIEVPTKENT